MGQDKIVTSLIIQEEINEALNENSSLGIVDYSMDYLVGFENSSSPEDVDSKEYFSEFKKSKFKLNEQWDSIITLNAKIIDYNDDIVTCDCLIDRDLIILETRDFPINIFSHLNLDVNKFIKIKIKEKGGSIRFDILSGEKSIDKTKFNVEEDIRSLDSFQGNSNFKYLIED